MTQLIETEQSFEDVFDGLAMEMLNILYDRQRKYGPKNIENQGIFGVIQRIANDKMARVMKSLNGRLVNGQVVLDDIAEADDESFEDTMFDIANYSLITIALRRGVWGRPLREDTGEVKALAVNGVRQLTEDEYPEDGAIVEPWEVTDPNYKGDPLANLSRRVLGEGFVG